MKINVNYELMAKIGEAKTGVNVHRLGKKMAILNGIMSLVSVMVTPNDLKQVAANILYSFSLISFQSIGLEIACANVQKKKANQALRTLASRLSTLDVSTNSELLMSSQKYQTKYKVNFNEGILPQIMQSKYIMVPTCNEGEVSLLQEHVVGTKEYVLSVGELEKSKQYRLAYNGI